MSAADRRLVLVVGAGRSGTSLLSGILGQLGFHLPQPEVEADDTNPRGFGEPRWVVDFHTRLLQGAVVTVNDSRPSAWASTGRCAQDDATVAELREWLAGELRHGDAVVVKDPRTAWFLPLWQRCAAELEVPPSFVTMLRHPAEIIASARKSYGDWQSPASRTAAWMNVMLETEHATRGDRRAFVPYERLLADWRAEVGRIGALLDLPLVTAGIDPARAGAVDRFVDPGLHRNRVRFDAHEVPERVVALAEQVWERFGPLAEPGGDAPAAHAALDASREAFHALHAEADAIAQSTAVAAKRSARQAAGARRTARRPAQPAPPPSLRVRVARRIPARHRKRLRKVLGSLRGGA